MSDKKPLEQRAYTFEVRAENSEKGTILSGRPIVYNQRTDLGYFDEYIAPGALDGADLTDVRFLVNHDASRIPLARSRRNNGNSTMQLTPDEFGLSLDWVRLDTENNAEARALWSAVDRGDISGMSFMFSVDGEEWKDLKTDHPTRAITKIGSIVEISACTFPAYDSTEIFARSREALESARATLEKESRQNADALESAKHAHDLEIAKLKTLTLTGGKK